MSTFNKINAEQIIIDSTNTEAFLIRKNNDAGDIFTINTSTSNVNINTDLSLFGDILGIGGTQIYGGDASSQNLVLNSTSHATKGQVKIADDTDSSSSTTGSLITAGGFGVAKKLYTGSDLDVTGNIIVSGTVDGRDIAADGIALDAVSFDQTLNTTDTVSFGAISFEGVSGNNNILITDNLSDAFNIKQSVNSYIKIGTTNGSELITISKETLINNVSVIGSNDGGSTEAFNLNGNSGLITCNQLKSDQLISLDGENGFIFDTANDEIDFQTSNTDRLILKDTLLQCDVPVQMPSYSVAGAPSASPAGQMVYITNETGGATIAFSDGTNWRRVSDRAVISA